MDFSPRPKGFNAPAARSSFDDTASKLAGRVLEVCAHLLPGGKQTGPEYESADLSGGRGKSLKVHLQGENRGLWKDFESGDGGHDLIALWAAVKGIKMVEAKQEAERWLGIEYRKPVPVSVPLAAKAPPPTDDNWWKSVKPTAKWDYVDADGVVYGTVYRFDDPTGQHKKEIRPWNGKEWKAPEGQRPLYNLQGVLSAPPGALLVLVEGEKCADAISALRDPMLVGFTSWGGAAAASRTDWSPLSGKNILRWPDNDWPSAEKKPDGTPKEVAREIWLRTTLEHISKAAPASLRDLVIPEGKPDGWDAADAGEAERRALIASSMAAGEVDMPKRVRLADMTADKLFTGKPKDPEWLVKSVIPFGRGGVFAAPGDTGKGMLMVDLAVKVATPKAPGLNMNPPMAFGHEVERHGAVVILSAEDDTDELHRRVLALGGAMPIEGKRRLYVLPYPDMTGRTPTYMTGDANKVDPTQEFRDVYMELKEIPDLVLTIVDPLSAFAGVDLSAPSASQQVGNALDKLAKDLGCTVIACHHLTKGDRRYPIETAADARHAIGGAGQLLNAMRFAYALWAPGETKEREILSTLGRDFTNNAVFRGAIVKANAASDRDIATYARNMGNGLLELVPWKKLREESLVVTDVPPHMSELLVHSIRHFSRLRRPALKTWICDTPRASKGKDSPTGQWFSLMPAAWQNYKPSEYGGVSRLKIMDALIAAGMILEMEGKQKHLYVPNDEWDSGEYRFPRDLDNSIKKPAPVPPLMHLVE